MVFQYGKTYRHLGTGRVLSMVGVADTRVHGKCLIGEDYGGNLTPISQDEAATLNYEEVTDAPTDDARKRHHDKLVAASWKLDAFSKLIYKGEGNPPRILVKLKDSIVHGCDGVQPLVIDDKTVEALRLSGFTVKLLYGESEGLSKYSTSYSISW
jgi:hypothetical protein